MNSSGRTDLSTVASSVYEALDPVAEEVRKQLLALGRKYRPLGARLFIFGSWVTGDAHPTSDIDIGIEWADPPDSETARAIREDIENLHTIRRIDVVDFSEVDTEFRQIALQKILYLTP